MFKFGDFGLGLSTFVMVGVLNTFEFSRVDIVVEMGLLFFLEVFLFGSIVAWVLTNLSLEFLESSLSDTINSALKYFRKTLKSQN